MGGLNLYICLAASSTYIEHYLYTFMISFLFPQGRYVSLGIYHGVFLQKMRL